MVDAGNCWKWSDVTDLCSSWKKERDKHPFFVENLSEERIHKCWDESSVNYSGSEYADIKGRILEQLHSDGIIDQSSEVLDIGCGPGLYDIPMSRMVKSITCVDGSEGMISRLNDSFRSEGIGNIVTQVAYWEEFDTDERYDVVFSSLCPALNNPESIIRMEKYSRGHCVYISSANPGPGLSLEVWRRLGKNCSFWGYDTHYPYEFLRMMGRDPSVRFYRNTILYERPVDEAIAMQERYIGKYREVDDRVRSLIRDVVLENEYGGVVRETKTLTLGLLTWEV